MDEISRFIGIVSNKSDRYGDKLLEMMDYFEVTNLASLTLPEIKEYIRIQGWEEK